MLAPKSIKRFGWAGIMLLTVVCLLLGAVPAAADDGKHLPAYPFPTPASHIRCSAPNYSKCVGNTWTATATVSNTSYDRTYAVGQFHRG
jgi:hypothetical protein